MEAFPFRISLWSGIFCFVTSHDLFHDQNAIIHTKKCENVIFNCGVWATGLLHGPVQVGSTTLMKTSATTTMGLF